MGDLHLIFFGSCLGPLGLSLGFDRDSPGLLPFYPDPRTGGDRSHVSQLVEQDGAMHVQPAAFCVRNCVPGRRRHGRTVEKANRRTVKARNFLFGKEKHATDASEDDEVGDVEQLLGVRQVELEDGQTIVEYLVAWKDDFPELWLPAGNIAEDLLSQYESAWWDAAKSGNELKLQEMLSGGKEVLVQTRDAEMRTALHYVCGLGALPCVQALLDAGADPDAADKDGYTPLHISAGYLNEEVVQCLLEHGADAEAEDRKGLSVLELVENLRERLPKDDPMVYRRMVVLDNVAKLLEDSVYEELAPVSILDKRERQGKVEYLVHWGDDQEDSWVREKLVGDGIVEAYESGLEYAEAESLLDKRIEEDGSVSFLVNWVDESEPSWEPKELVDPALVQGWYVEHGDKDEQLWAAEQKKKEEDAKREELADAAPSGLGLGFGDAPVKF